VAGKGIINDRTVLLKYITLFNKTRYLPGNIYFNTKGKPSPRQDYIAIDFYNKN